MQENVLFHDAHHEISITPSVARFGAISYQVSNICSAVVSYERKLNGVAIFLFIASLVAALVSYLIYQDLRFQPYIMHGIGTSIALLIASMLWQHIRPRYEYRFVLKTASDTHVMVTNDREMVYRLKTAIEEAFTLRHSSFQ